MKFNIWPILCLWLFAVTATAQKTYRVPNSQRYYLGVKGGPLVSWATFRDPDLKDMYSSSPVAGYYVAGLINFSLKKNYSFQSEFGYSQQGRNISFADGAWTNASTYKFMDFAMMLRRSFELKLIKDVPTNWFVNVGPNIKYWMSGKGTVANIGSPQGYDIIFNGTPKGDYDKLYYFEPNRWLFGLDLGIGATIGALPKQHVMVEFRLTYGQTYLGTKNSVTSQSLNVLGFNDTLLCNIKSVSVTIAYTYDFFTGQGKMGKSTQRDLRKKK
ncbi:MAG TPA: porin family protein [Cyclobacteriaceae bacterium]|nr:porin family protein [Cyclobacteriaceae bacterium]